MNRLQTVGRVGQIGLGLVLAACGVADPQGTVTPPTTSTPPKATAPAVTASPALTPSPSATATPAATPTAQANHFQSELFAALGDESVSADLAAELQDVLEKSANGDGLTATLITPEGTWSGATGFAAGDRPMRPDDQMAIASITKTLVAAQVMQLVEAGELGLDDPAADHLLPTLEFDTNGATIADLLSMRSGIPENLDSEEVWDSLLNDPLHVWTTDEVLATVGPERGPVGQAFEYRGNNYLLLVLIIEQVTGRPLAEVLRSGVLGGDEYERLVYQPDERPTDPMAMPYGDSADTFDDLGGYLPTLAAATAVSDSAMASDSLSLARWFRGLCAAQVVSAVSLNEMTDFEKRPEYGLGIIDRRGEYGLDSGALGHTGALFGFTSVALCFQNPGMVVVALANEEHDIDTTAGNLWRAASN